MRQKVNQHCNIVDGEHSSCPYGKTQITVPQFRMRLWLDEADWLASDLLQAIQVARASEIERFNAHGIGYVRLGDGERYQLTNKASELFDERGRVEAEPSRQMVYSTVDAAETAAKNLAASKRVAYLGAF